MEKSQSDNPTGYRLSEQEKDAMRLVVEAHMKALPPGLIQSPWMRFLTVPSFLALAALFLCAGTSYASYGAVPGDFLYPVKVYVTEPTRLLVAVTSRAEVRAQLKIAEERVAEARILEERNALDEATARKLQERFEVHMRAALLQEEESDAGIAAIAFNANAEVSPFQIYTSMIERAAQALGVVPETVSVPATPSSPTKDVTAVSATSISTAMQETVLSVTASSTAEAATTTLLEIANVPVIDASPSSKKEPAVTSSAKEDDTDDDDSPTASAGSDDSDKDEKSSILKSVKDAVSDTIPSVSLPSLR